ncbi:phosphoenolpyruvate synthase [Lipomyces tetrasporus]
MTSSSDFLRTLGWKISILLAERTRLLAYSFPTVSSLTTYAYCDALKDACAWPKLDELLDHLDTADVTLLGKHAVKARQVVYDATGTDNLRRLIAEAYRSLEAEYCPEVAVAVEVQPPPKIFPPPVSPVHLSVGVMKLVRSDRTASGVTFTLDTESGFRDVVLTTGAYGLGENIVQGVVDPDEFYVHKPTFRQVCRVVLRRVLGKNQLTMGLAKNNSDGSTTKNEPTPTDMQKRFCLTDDEVLLLAGHALLAEDHYSRHAGHSMPMDIEWAKDGDDGRLYIVQARPETVASRKTAAMLETYSLHEKGTVIAHGRAVGEKISCGIVRIISTHDDLARFRSGEVLTCHAAIIARELGVPAVVGTETGTQLLKSGQRVTVSCAAGEMGTVYEVIRIDADRLPHPRTPIMVNLGNPELAFHTAMMPNSGVGLARIEFIISEYIGIHHMAITEGCPSASEYFVRHLSEGIGTIAAAFYPKPVIVRLSDFKTNEYAALIGGTTFEPQGANPMIGFWGASRYAHPAYADGFALECAALARARRAMGLTNIIAMIPFYRRVEEAQRVLAAMAQNGLIRGKDGLEIYVMCEIPNNVIQIDAFANEFDGFSIGSNEHNSPSA